MSVPIITVTLNPALDLSVALDALVPGEVHRARDARFGIGGKGINVAGCIADWGMPVLATGVLGRGNDGPFADFFRDKGIQDRFVRTSGETRTNIKLRDLATNVTTDINLPGLGFDEDTYDMVLDVLAREAVPGALVVLAGSLPSVLDEDVWCKLTRELKGRGARVILDTSGTPLTKALDAPREGLPFAIKPNCRELESWVGHPLETEEEIVAAGRILIERGIELVVVSRGEQGAIFLRSSGAISAKLPVVNALSTVGAGDAMVAGITTGIIDNLGNEALARRAVAFATAKLGQLGPHLPHPDDVRQMSRQVQLTALAM